MEPGNVQDVENAVAGAVMKKPGCQTKLKIA